MFFRKSKLISALRAEIQRLRALVAYLTGQNTQLQQGYEGMKEVAAKALEVAKEKHFPPGSFNSERYDDDGLHDLKVKYWIHGELGNLVYNENDHLPDPDTFSVKFCPECNVSVRSDSWPQECPACHCTFGFEGMEE